MGFGLPSAIGAQVARPGEQVVDIAGDGSFEMTLQELSTVQMYGLPVKKANHLVRIGDIVVLPQGGWQRTVQILALGLRRGPAAEACLLYEEAGPALRLARRVGER